MCLSFLEECMHFDSKIKRMFQKCIYQGHHAFLDGNAASLYGTVHHFNNLCFFKFKCFPAWGCCIFCRECCIFSMNTHYLSPRNKMHHLKAALHPCIATNPDFFRQKCISTWERCNFAEKKSCFRNKCCFQTKCTCLKLIA